jgi:tRNA threonylcarbamoyladenosine biosynthesis protein TsaB
MARILCIETATNICSVALSGDGTLLSVEESSIRNSHSSVIISLIESVLAKSGTTLQDLDAIAIGEGPGSYTGLRIGVATAKGLCYSLGKPLIAIGTLPAMALGMRAISQKVTQGSVFYCPMIDARRMEVYRAVYSEDGDEILPPSAEVIDEHSFRDFRNDPVLILAGDGAMKCKDVMKGRPNVVFLDDFSASAKFMATLANRKYQESAFADLAYFEPFYLKDFIAGKPRVKGLR